MKKSICSFIAALVLAVVQSSLQAEVRAFTSITGTTIRGELDTVNGDMVTIKKEDGKFITTKAANFSGADQAYLKEHGLKDAAGSADLARAMKDKPFINSLGMKFVPVPETKILFCIHVTRRADYAAFAAAVPGADSTWKTYPPEKDSKGNLIAQGDDYPVVGVNWDDAKAFCDWLSKKEGRNYRMPSDHEWSYAVGIGKMEEGKNGGAPENLNGKIKDVYAWGTDWPPPRGAGNFADSSLVAMFPTWTDEKGKKHPAKGIPGYTDGYPLTNPVFAFKPNRLGIYDLAGNIHQWCDGWFDEGKTKRLSRGCPYNHSGKVSLVASWRTGFDPNTRLIFNIGFSSFRVVVELPNSQP